jgi:hypothetical protein
VVFMASSYLANVSQMRCIIVCFRFDVEAIGGPTRTVGK